jgi:hypothetical protein
MLFTPLVEQIIARIDQVTGLYHRLILVVAPSGAGKTSVLRQVSGRTGFPYINVNLELSRRLLELTERQRALQAPRLLSDIALKNSDRAVLLDNLEVLFDVSLKQDPLRCLQGLGRQITVVASWTGTHGSSYLTYATPEHPEYRRYPAGDLLIVSPQSPAQRP